MSEFNGPQPEQSLREILDDYQDIATIDPFVHDALMRAARVVPFQPVTANVSSLLDDRGHRMCDTQSADVAIRSAQQGSIELRAYQGDEQEKSVYLFASRLSIPLGERVVEGMVASETAIDGRHNLKVIHQSAGEINLSEQEQTIARLRLLQYFNEALADIESGHL